MVRCYKKHPLLSLLNLLSPFFMMTLELFLNKHNNGEIPTVFEVSTGRHQLMVLDSMTLPKVFTIVESTTQKPMPVKKIEDYVFKRPTAEKLFVWVGHPKEKPEEVIYLVGPMNKMKEVVLQ